MTLVSSVTAPLRASAAPQLMVAPVISVMLLRARILPWNAVVLPNVAELPTRKNTLLALAPLISTTDEAAAVVRVLPMLKTKMALGSPPASSVRVPVNCAEVL